MDYTIHWGKTCDAWVLNPHGPARKRCSNSATHKLAEVSFLCTKHMNMVVDQIEDLVESRMKDDLDIAVSGLALYRKMYGPITQSQIDQMEKMDRLMDTPFEEWPKAPERYVYFIECEGYVKIGMSGNPERRLKSLQVSGNGTYAPKLIDLTTAKIIAVEDGGPERERELHQRFDSSRYTGEWFTKTPELMAYIDSLDSHELLAA